MGLKRSISVRFDVPLKISISVRFDVSFVLYLFEIAQKVTMTLNKLRYATFIIILTVKFLNKI
jgi:hypothetical protein